MRSSGMGGLGGVCGDGCNIIFRSRYVRTNDMVRVVRRKGCKNIGCHRPIGSAPS